MVSVLGQGRQAPFYHAPEYPVLPIIGRPEMESEWPFAPNPFVHQPRHTGKDRPPVAVVALIAVRLDIVVPSLPRTSCEGFGWRSATDDPKCDGAAFNR